MHVSAALEAAIRERPDDVEAHLVYGDWLAERGDPQGELVTIQAKLREGEDEALRQRSWELLDAVCKTYPPALAALGPSYDFELGFLRKLTLTPPRAITSGSFAKAFRAVFEIPRVELVRALRIDLESDEQGPSTYFDGRSNASPSWLEVVHTLVELGLPRGVVSLSLDQTARDSAYWTTAEIEIGDVSSLRALASRLESLRIGGPRMILGDLSSASLRAATFDVEVATEENVASIAAARWPALRSLVFSASEARLMALLPILARETAPELEHLGVAFAPWSDALVGALSVSPLLPRLRSLAILGDVRWGRGGLTSAGAEALARAPAFRHLTRLDLSGNKLSDGLLARLASLGPELVVDTDLWEL
jgi:uncharacterized protein (TIGR02996 family)